MSTYEIIRKKEQEGYQRRNKRHKLNNRESKGVSEKRLCSEDSVL